MAIPSYDPMWIQCSDHWPQADLPVLWQPFSDGPNVPPQFIAPMNALPDPKPQHWSWRPTGIYRTLAWENGYVKWAGLAPDRFPESEPTQ